MHRVSECMAETDSFSVTGHKYDDTPKPFIEFTGARRSGALLDTRLVIIPGEPGVFIAVAGMTEELDEAAADACASGALCHVTSGCSWHRISLDGSYRPSHHSNYRC